MSEDEENNNISFSTMWRSLDCSAAFNVRESTNQRFREKGGIWMFGHPLVYSKITGLIRNSPSRDPWEDPSRGLRASRLRSGSETTLTRQLSATSAQWDFASNAPGSPALDHGFNLEAIQQWLPPAANQIHEQSTAGLLRASAAQVFSTWRPQSLKSLLTNH